MEIFNSRLSAAIRRFPIATGEIYRKPTRVLFCKIAHMKCYKGILEDIDEPINGGEYVQRTGDAHEKYNFKPKEQKCFGFVETKSTNGQCSNQLHIEKIKGCELMKKAYYVDDVLVVWFATNNKHECVVVGWYKNATVYRWCEKMIINGDEQYYNTEADYKNVVLLPNDGTRSHWAIPKTFDFGRPLVRFPTKEKDKEYLNQLLKKIKNYNGENWIDMYPDEIPGIIKI